MMPRPPCARTPVTEREDELHEHRLVREGGLIQDDLTLDEHRPAPVVRRGEILIGGHPLRALRHGVHRSRSLSSRSSLS